MHLMDITWELLPKMLLTNGGLQEKIKMTLLCLHKAKLRNAQKAGKFKNEIIPIVLKSKNMNKNLRLMNIPEMA